MALTLLQKKSVQAIVSIFESGSPKGDYGCVTVLKGDSGHLTYGRLQTTLGSGNLALLLKAYADAQGAFASALAPYQDRVEDKDFTLDHNADLKALLREAARDPVMRRVQDEFFDRAYWNPAVQRAEHKGIVTPLGVNVVFDSTVHGSYGHIRDRVNSKLPGPFEEKTWIRTYVSERRDWLATHSNSILHATVYRMDAFSTLMDADKWDLPLPLTVRGCILTQEVLEDTAWESGAVRVDAAERVLKLTTPPMTGSDVEALQKALGMTGDDLDGIFGSATEAKVRAFQQGNSLKQDGKAGPITRAALGL